MGRIGRKAGLALASAGFDLLKRSGLTVSCRARRSSMTRGKAGGACLKHCATNFPFRPLSAVGVGEPQRHLSRAEQLSECPIKGARI